MRQAPKKLLTILLIIGALSISALAAWLVGIENNITGNVVSDQHGTIYWSQEWQNLGSIDTTNSSQTIIRNATITNTNGLIPVRFNVTITQIDYDDECTDYINDVSAIFYYEGNVIENGDIINITSGQTNYDAQLMFVRSSCPQNVSIYSHFSEVQI